MTYASVCSGIEAPSVAWATLGWQPVFFAEIDRFPSAVLAHHYPDVPNLGDILALDPAPWRGNVDVLIGGTPCQSFSVAGLRGSLKDARGNLTLRFVELVHGINPRFAVWENVPGVLSTHDNAFGCFLGGLVGHDAPIATDGRNSWPDAGVVTGPLGTACWRVLDAQYFGLAQRRARVFVVFCPRGGADPAEVLFEWEGMRRDSPPSREAGQKPAGRIAARARGGGGLGTDFECDGGLIAHEVSESISASGRGTARTGSSRGQDPVVACFGGNDTRGPIDLATACRAKGGSGHGDFESETFIAHALRADGFDASEDGTGRGTPLVVAESLRSHPGPDPRAGVGIGEPGDPMYTLQGGKQHAIAFDTTQITSPGNYSNPRPGDACHRLAAEAHPPAVALAIRGRDGVPQVEMGDEIANAILTPNGGRGGIGCGATLQGMAVRRLTPRECERLQGFPDNYTLIPYHGKPAADGPRYKALGNSMAVPVIRWIGERIEHVLALS